MPYLGADMYLDPYGQPNPYDFLPKSIPERATDDNLYPWPSTPGQNPDMDWSERFAHKAAMTGVPAELIALMRPSVQESSGTFERPSISPMSQPTVRGGGSHVGLKGLAGFIGVAVVQQDLSGLGRLGGWSIGQFFRSRQADRIAMAIGGPVGVAINRAIINPPADPEARKLAVQGLLIPQAAVASVLAEKKKETAQGREVAVQDQAIVLAARELNVSPKDLDKYCSDPAFAREAMLLAIQNLRERGEKLDQQLKDNAWEQQAVRNELEQIADPNVRPVPGARSYEEIAKDNATIVQKVMDQASIAPTPENLAAVSSQVTDEWVRREQDTLKAAQAESDLVVAEKAAIDQALKGVTVGMKMDDFWGGRGR